MKKQNRTGRRVSMDIHPDLVAAWQRRADQDRQTLTAVVELALAAYLGVPVPPRRAKGRTRPILKKTKSRDV